MGLPLQAGAPAGPAKLRGQRPCDGTFPRADRWADWRWNMVASSSASQLDSSLHSYHRRADGVQKAHPDTRALPFRHDDQAASARLDDALTGRERDVSHRLVSTMPTKHVQRSSSALSDSDAAQNTATIASRSRRSEIDWRTSLKPPPGKAAGAGIEDPVRLQPIQNVIVAGKHDDLTARSAPGFRERMSADLGNLPVDHAGELVDDRPCRRRADQSGEIRAKSFSGREHLVRSQPSRTAPSPTAESAPVTWSKSATGAIASMIGASVGQPSAPQTASAPNSARPIDDFPEPDGPTTAPIFQSRPSMGRSASRSNDEPSSTLNSDLPARRGSWSRQRTDDDVNPHVVTTRSLQCVSVCNAS